MTTITTALGPHTVELLDLTIDDAPVASVLDTPAGRRTQLRTNTHPLLTGTARLLFPSLDLTVIRDLLEGYKLGPVTLTDTPLVLTHVATRFDGEALTIPGRPARWLVTLVWSEVPA